MYQHVKRQGKSQKLSNEQIVKTIKKFNEEYIFCSKFVNTLKKEFNLHFSIDEVVFLTLFINQESLEETSKNKPVVLVAMYGNSTAASIVEVANKLLMMEIFFHLIFIWIRTCKKHMKS